MEFVSFVDSGKILPEGLPFSEAVRVGDMLYLSGQLGIVHGTTRLVPGGIREEAKQTLSNIRIALEAQGLTLKNVVRCTIMLADIAEWQAFNDVYKEFFTKPFPARSAFGVAGLALGARVEVECIAAYSG
jgi:reactive intermediate/imine deaminase